MINHKRRCSPLLAEPALEGSASRQTSRRTGLARQLSPYGIRSRNMRIDGAQAKGYCAEDLIESVRRYVPQAEARALLAPAD